MTQDLWVLLFWIAVTVPFCAYTLNVQRTTLELGKRLAPDNPHLPSGLQDAITPSWQTRNNLIMYGLWILAAIQAFVSLPWYGALLLVPICFFMGVPLVSRLAVPAPMSAALVNKIRKDCEHRVRVYEKTGDNLRAEALSEILNKLDLVDP